MGTLYRRILLRAPWKRRLLKIIQGNTKNTPVGQSILCYCCPTKRNFVEFLNARSITIDYRCTRNLLWFVFMYRFTKPFSDKLSNFDIEAHFSRFLFDSTQQSNITKWSSFHLDFCKNINILWYVSSIVLFWDYLGANPNKNKRYIVHVWRRNSCKKKK